MNESLAVRIASIFIIGIMSFLGICSPFLIKNADISVSPFFRCMKCCAAGVMAGLGLIHLLPDANRDLSEIVKEYDIAFALTAFGVIIILAIEQLTIIAMNALSNSNRKNNRRESYKSVSTAVPTNDVLIDSLLTTVDDTNDSNLELEKRLGTPLTYFEYNKNLHRYYDDEDYMVIPNVQQHDYVLTKDNRQSSAEIHSHELNVHVFENLMSTSNFKEIITAYAMEISIAVHSIIIGVDVGLLSGDSQFVTLVSLVVAISFHQFVEGFGLGTTILSAKLSLGNSKIALFVLIFSLTVSIGIIIGICTSSQKTSDVQILCKGTANCLAAGALLYISLTEMVGEYFSASDLMTKPKLRVAMLAAFSMGVLFMAVIAIWA